MIPDAPISLWTSIGYFALVNFTGIAIGWTARQILIVRPMTHRRRSPWWRNL